MLFSPADTEQINASASIILKKWTGRCLLKQTKSLGEEVLQPYRNTPVFLLPISLCLNYNESLRTSHQSFFPAYTAYI